MRQHPQAVALATAVHSNDTAAVAELLATADLPELCVALARMVEVPRPLQPHGTHAAFNRHRKAGQEPCDKCRDGERAFQAERRRRERRERREAELREAKRVDEIAVERFLNGHDVPLNKVEKAEAARLLHLRGESVTAIARRLRWHSRTVHEVLAGAA